MKLIQKIKEKNLQVVLYQISIYVVGAVADSFGHLSGWINFLGFVLQMVAAISIICTLIIACYYNAIKEEHMAIINIISIIVSVLLIGIYRNFAMAPLKFTLGFYSLFSIIMLMISIIKMTLSFEDALKEENGERIIEKIMSWL